MTWEGERRFHHVFHFPAALKKKLGLRTWVWSVLSPVLFNVDLWPYRMETTSWVPLSEFSHIDRDLLITQQIPPSWRNFWWSVRSCIEFRIFRHPSCWSSGYLYQSNVECAGEGKESEKADRIKSPWPLCDLHLIVSGRVAGNAYLSFNLIVPEAGNAKLSRKFSQLLVAAYYFVVRRQSILVQLQNISNIDLRWTRKRGTGRWENTKFIQLLCDYFCILPRTERTILIVARRRKEGAKGRTWKWNSRKLNKKLGFLTFGDSNWTICCPLS